METYTDILLIACCYVFILDVSGAWDELSARVKALLTHGMIKTPFELKPFSCSLCMTFWTGLAYLLVVHRLTIPNAAYVCLVAYLTPRIKDMLVVFDGLLAAIFDKINRKL